MRTRLHWIQQLQNAGSTCSVPVRPTAWVSPSAQLGPASGVFALAVQAQRLGIILPIKAVAASSTPKDNGFAHADAADGRSRCRYSAIGI